jgi:hypothetical protein
MDTRLHTIELESVKRRLVADNLQNNMDSNFVNRLEEEYRKYLTIILDNPEFDVSPSKCVDEFWHTHILDTRKYANDCEEIFGGYLHHIPLDDDKEERNAPYLATLRLYRSTFGDPPADIWQEAGGGSCRGGSCRDALVSRRITLSPSAGRKAIGGDVG